MKRPDWRKDIFGTNIELLLSPVFEWLQPNFMEKSLWIWLRYKIIAKCMHIYLRVNFLSELVWWKKLYNPDPSQKGLVIRSFDILFVTSLNKSLLWRHNRRNGVSNRQPYDCFLNRLSRRRSKKTSKRRVTGFFVRNSPVNSTHKRPVSQKMFPFDGVIMSQWFLDIMKLLGRHHNGFQGKFLYWRTVRRTCRGNWIDIKLHPQRILFHISMKVNEIQYAIHYKMHIPTISNLSSSIPWRFGRVLVSVIRLDSPKQW